MTRLVLAFCVFAVGSFSTPVLAGTLDARQWLERANATLLSSAPLIAQGTIESADANGNLSEIGIQIARERRADEKHTRILVRERSAE